MRRDLYPQIKEEKNARHRELYAESSKRFLNKQIPFSYNGENLFIPNGTEIMHQKTIAGNGSKNYIKDISRIVKTYSGKPEEWKKRVGKVESDRFILDIHWYEKNGIMYEQKIKEVHKK